MSVCPHFIQDGTSRAPEVPHTATHWGHTK